MYDNTLAFLTYIYIYIYMYVYTHTHTHTRAYTHTQKELQYTDMWRSKQKRARRGLFSCFAPRYDEEDADSAPSRACINEINTLRRVARDLAAQGVYVCMYLCII